MPRGMMMATGTARSSRPLFSSTRQKIGFFSCLTYVDGPIQWETSPSHRVIE